MNSVPLAIICSDTSRDIYKKNRDDNNQYGNRQRDSVLLASDYHIGWVGCGIGGMPEQCEEPLTPVNIPSFTAGPSR